MDQVTRLGSAFPSPLIPFSRAFAPTRRQPPTVDRLVTSLRPRSEHLFSLCSLSRRCPSVFYVLATFSAAGSPRGWWRWGVLQEFRPWTGGRAGDAEGARGIARGLTQTTQMFALRRALDNCDFKNFSTVSRNFRAPPPQTTNAAATANNRTALASCRGALLAFMGGPPSAPGVVECPASTVGTVGVVGGVGVGVGGGGVGGGTTAEVLASSA